MPQFNPYGVRGNATRGVEMWDRVLAHMKQFTSDSIIVSITTPNGPFPIIYTAGSFYDSVNSKWITQRKAASMMHDWLSFSVSVTFEALPGLVGNLLRHQRHKVLNDLGRVILAHSTEFSTKNNRFVLSVQRIGGRSFGRRPTRRYVR